MRVFLYDTNLILSSRLSSQLRNLGYEVVKDRDVKEVCVALINLEEPKGLELVKELKGKGISVVGYCGHKNFYLFQQARELGVDLVVSNGQIVSNLKEILERFCR